MIIRILSIIFILNVSSYGCMKSYKPVDVISSEVTGFRIKGLDLDTSGIEYQGVLDSFVLLLKSAKPLNCSEINYKVANSSVHGWIQLLGSKRIGWDCIENESIGHYFVFDLNRYHCPELSRFIYDLSKRKRNCEPERTCQSCLSRPDSVDYKKPTGF